MTWLYYLCVTQVILPCLKSMTWVMENRTLPPANRVAVINLKVWIHSINAAAFLNYFFYIQYLFEEIFYTHKLQDKRDIVHISYL